MSNIYDYEDSPPRRVPPKIKLGFDLWDMLSILTLIATFFVGMYFLAVFLLPYSFLNPLPPVPPGYGLPPSPTITPLQMEPTWTPTAVNATETPTLVPTITLVPSPTVVSLVTPSITPSPTRTPRAPYSATVTYIDSTIIHPESACNWQGVGGTIVDANNADILSLTLRLTGFYSGKSRNELTVSGIAPVYGKSGYEFFLGAVPISSRGELYIQIFDQAGMPLSDNIPLDTFNDCSKNLALVRFKKNP
jgi:hypothetical protein